MPWMSTPTSTHPYNLREKGQLMSASEIERTLVRLAHEILCDDVLYPGRTTRAALDALFDHGRPRRVQLGVLIDRGHRELPIEAAFIGRVVQTTDREIVEVKFQEVDGAEKVLLVERTT